MKYLGISFLIYMLLLISSNLLRKLGILLYSELIVFFISLIIVGIFVKISKIKAYRETVVIAILVGVYFTIIPLILNGTDYFINDIFSRIVKTILFVISSYIGSIIPLYLTRKFNIGER